MLTLVYNDKLEDPRLILCNYYVIFMICTYIHTADNLPVQMSDTDTARIESSRVLSSNQVMKCTNPAYQDLSPDQIMKCPDPAYQDLSSDQIMKCPDPAYQDLSSFSERATVSISTEDWTNQLITLDINYK